MQKNWVRALTTLTTLTMMALIFLFSTQSAEQSDATSGTFAGWAADLTHPGWREMPEEERLRLYNEAQHAVRKAAHFTEFLLLGISLRLCLESWLGRRSFLWILSWGGGTLYAAMDEFHQLLVDGRSGQWTDALIDSAGVLCGTLLAAAAVRALRKRKEKTVRA